MKILSFGTTFSDEAKRRIKKDPSLKKYLPELFKVYSVNTPETNKLTDLNLLI